MNNLSVLQTKMPADNKRFGASERKCRRESTVPRRKYISKMLVEVAAEKYLVSRNFAKMCEIEIKFRMT